MTPQSVLRGTLLVLAAWVATACSTAVGSADAAARSRHGRLVIIGGGLSRDSEAIYRAILAGREGSGPLCVIPSAGGEAEHAIASAVPAFDRWGGPGTAAGVPISTGNPEAADDPAVAGQIRGCSGFYFTGGAQSRIMTVFRPHGRSTAAYEALMARFREGAVVAGTSAGAAIMSDPMIAGGNVRDAIARGVHRTSAESDDGGETENVNPVIITPGLGFLPEAIVDQHFLARGRIGRLITAVLDLDEFDLGFGIDENTALVVDGHSAQAAGESGVIVIDARNAERSARSATNLTLHLLASRDRFDIETGRVTPAADRTALPATTAGVTVPDDRSPAGRSSTCCTSSRAPRRTGSPSPFPAARSCCGRAPISPRALRVAREWRGHRPDSASSASGWT